jgi:RNA-splicing ligase RtcB
VLPSCYEEKTIHHSSAEKLVAVWHGISSSFLEVRSTAKRARKLQKSYMVWKEHGTQEHWEVRLQNDGISCLAGEQWDNSLGTVGTGNHFAEIQIVEGSTAASEGHVDLQENDVVLLTYSGSRGYGSSLLGKYTAGPQDSLEESGAQRSTT